MSREHLAMGERDAQNREFGEAIAVEKTNNGRTARRMGAIGVLTLLLVVAVAFLPTPASAAGNAGGQVSVGISVSFGPPPLPVYAQPMCPGPGYIWTPGYWGYDRDDGYYWVPGTWVMAPFPGALWTPGYWGWDPTAVVFVWHSGYWGTRVGFYGGINYGFGYPGRGYYGGYWDHDRFFYNRAYNRVDVRIIRRFYDRDEHHRHWDDRRISYNGGRDGVRLRPTWREREAEHDRRMGPNHEQWRHEMRARRMPEERWSVNHGRPRIAATRRPERFMGHGVERASRAGGPYEPHRTGRHGDRAQRQNGDWHSFGGGRNGRNEPAQRGYRDAGRRDNGSQPRYNGRRDQMRQTRGQRSDPQRGFARPGEGTGRQRDRQGRANAGWQQRQQPRQQGRPAYSRPERQRNGYSRQSGGNRQRMSRQQQSRGARAERNQRGNAERQKRSNDKQGKKGEPHGRRHR